MSYKNIPNTKVLGICFRNLFLIKFEKSRKMESLTKSKEQTKAFEQLAKAFNVSFEVGNNKMLSMKQC